MTDEEVARMVTDLISTWPMGVRGHVWTRELGPLRHDLARASYLHLCRNADRPISVARFLEEYRGRERALRQRAERQPELPIREEPPVAPTDPRAMTAYERGVIQGRAELHAIHERNRIEVAPTFPWCVVP